MIKTPQKIVSFSQGNVEALVKSSQILAAGVQNLTKQIASQAQASIDESLSNFRTLTSVRTVKDAIGLQTSFARAAVDKAVTQTGQVAEASFKLAEQVVAPIAARVNLAVETFGKAA